MILIHVKCQNIFIFLVCHCIKEINNYADYLKKKKQWEEEQKKEKEKIRNGGKEKKEKKKGEKKTYRYSRYRRHWTKPYQPPGKPSHPVNNFKLCFDNFCTFGETLVLLLTLDDFGTNYNYSTVVMVSVLIVKMYLF